MGPHESLSEDLSNNYQCYTSNLLGFQSHLKILFFFYFLILVTKVDLRP
jgi:hypothetical protein